MKAFKIEKTGEYSIGEMAIPQPVAGEVLIKVKKLGLCGSDLNTWRGLNPMVKYPRIIGHELSGIIEEVGEGVPSHIEEGTAVTVVPYTNCGKCASCKRGRVNACENNQTMGVQRDGASAEYITTPWEKLIIEESLNLDELVMVEPMSVGFHAVSRGQVSDADTVAVFGCGMIGLGAIAGAAAKTSTVIAIDIADEKLVLAKEIGASHTINSMNTDLHEALSEMTGGKGPDVMIEAVGLPLTFRQAVDEVAFSGRVVYIGYAKEQVCYETKKFVMKELDIRGSRNATAQDFEDVVNVLKSGKVPVEKLISERFSLDDTWKGLQTWADDPSKITKIVIDFDL